uniref:Cadherin domain-containing protein n=1 Tax=Sinocyclocheilus rhinocerous TaxID=307959 RepID=A0A673KLL6_9TELE
MPGPEAMARHSVLFLTLLIQTARGQVSYSIPEEMTKGSTVGNIAQDLGLDLQRLKSGKARIFTRDSTEYIELNRNTGLLLIREKMDRESLCAKTTPCAVHLQMILENPMELYTITIEITDINDNAPSFLKKDFRFEISESAAAGAGFMLGRAFDPDVGTNALQSYSLKPSDQFRLELHSQADGSKNVEMILQSPLDRETQSSFTLLLEAFDGGDPVLSGTVQIHIIVRSVLFLTLLVHIARGQVSYSIPEEMEKGSIVGNIAQDLGLDLQRLKSGKYIGLDKENGHLVVKNKIDREELCGEISACSVSFDVIFENPMELYRVSVDIQDINDNSPVFPKSKIEQKISELAVLGARFPLESAIDPDVGVNTLKKYTLQPTDHFKLNVQNGAGGNKNVEMVLHSPLDREKKQHHNLILTAFDGGKPQRSATVQINIIVLDVNDNAPVFSQSSYKTSVVENAPKTTIVTKISATDADESSHGIQYNFEHVTYTVKALFSIDADSGEVKVIGDIDYEKHKQFTVKVKASDHGGLTDSSEIIIDVIDVNDNAPKITIMSFSSAVSEDAIPGTVIAMINVQDLDSGDNNKITCSIDLNSPFKIVSSLTNYYNLVTDSELDREQTAEYNITITAVDGGNPPLSSKEILNLKLSDVNDHAPQFEQESYNAFIAENNPPSTTILTVKAIDMDWGQNAKVSYFLIDGDLNGAPLASYISINSESGVIYAEKSFDYEQLKSFKMQVKAQDGGSPLLSNNVTVNIIIQDQNDNAPQVLYPIQTGASVVAEIVPRAADVGYLVTKVVAVDVDSGQNAWLSYKLQKATDRALFEVGLQNGEIRTVRQVTDKDAVKQKLAVVVEDNGQPSRSAVVSINVAVADSFPEVLSEFTDFTHEKQYIDNLTFYLILALAVVSLLFILFNEGLYTVVLCSFVSLVEVHWKCISFY